MTSVFEIISRYNRELLQGLSITIKLCLWIYPIGIILGTLLGIARSRWKTTVGFLSSAIGLTLSSMPVIVFLFWMHYPMQYLLHLVIDPFITSVFVLSVVMIFMISDIIKTSLNEFPKELLQAAQVCGLSNKTSILKIQLPLIYRQTLPGILITMINILQATLFTSLISVNEIFRVAQQINADIYKPVEIYTALALFFIGICVALNILAHWLKSKYKWSITEI